MLDVSIFGIMQINAVVARCTVCVSYSGSDTAMQVQSVADKFPASHQESRYRFREDVKIIQRITGIISVRIGVQIEPSGRHTSLEWP